MAASLLPIVRHCCLPRRPGLPRSPELEVTTKLQSCITTNWWRPDLRIPRGRSGAVYATMSAEQPPRGAGWTWSFATSVSEGCPIPMTSGSSARRSRGSSPISPRRERRRSTATAGLAIPSFADSHSHLDKSMMIYQSPPAVTGTITESLARLVCGQAGQLRGRRRSARPPGVGVGGRQRHRSHPGPLRCRPRLGNHRRGGVVGVEADVRRRRGPPDSGAAGCEPAERRAPSAGAAGHGPGRRRHRRVAPPGALPCRRGPLRGLRVRNRQGV